MIKLEKGDKVRLKDWDEKGEVIKVRPDGGVWVETDCNMYRNWLPDAFVKLDEFQVLLDSISEYPLLDICMLDDCGCSGKAYP